MDTVDRIYTPVDAADLDYDRDLGYPGEPPYARGVYSMGYRGRFWTIREYTGFSMPEDANEWNHYLLEQGQTSLSVAFNLPTQMGYDFNNSIVQARSAKRASPSIRWRRY